MNGRWWLNQHPLVASDNDLFQVGGACRELAARLRSSHREDDDGGLENLVVSLEGRRGSGNTSFVNLLVDEIVGPEAGGAPVVVRCNLGRLRAAEMSVWSMIAYRIGEAVYRRFHRQCIEARGSEVEIASPAEVTQAGEGAPIRLKTDQLDNPKLHWLEVAWRVSSQVPKESWSPCLNLFADAPSKISGRRLDWRQGQDAILSTVGTVVAGLLGERGKVVDGAGETFRKLFAQRLVEGPAWGVDTVEFVGELGRLLRVFHGGRAGWRAIVVLDGLHGMKDGEVEDVHDALYSLRQLDGALVLLVVDPRSGRLLEISEDRRRPDPGEAELGGRRSGSHEGLRALIDLRLPTPTPSSHELIAMTRRFVEELGLPISLPEINHFTLYLRLRGVVRPRETKRALFWLWFRLHRATARGTLLDNGGAASIDPDHRRGILELLLDLHLFIEGRLDGPRLMKTAEKHFAVFAHFPVRPWNLLAWTDRQERSLGVWDGRIYSDARDLVLVLRLLSLGEFVGASEALSGHTAWARELWSRCRAVVIQEDPLALETMDDSKANALATHLENRLSAPGLALALALGHLFSACRRFDIPGTEEPTLPAHRLRESWFESELLTRIVQDDASSRESRRRSWVLLNLVHPLAAEVVGSPPRPDDWKESDHPLLASLTGQRKALIDTLRQNL